MKEPRKPLVFDISLSPVSKDEIARAKATTPKSDTVERQQLGARIPSNVYKELRVRAVMEGVLVQDLVERAIVEFLARSR